MAGNKTFNNSIEGLRGFAAFTVALWHIFYFKFKLDPGYAVTGELFETNFAHNSVLLFFIISGYVIGLTNRNEFSSAISTTYLKKRWVRLYPLYFLAILFSIIVTHGDSLRTITGNLLFIQYMFTPTITANPVLWTLNFEVLYYLLFIIIIATKVRLRWLFALNFFLAHIVLVWNKFPIMISEYATGWIFWLAGLYAAWYIPVGKNGINGNKVISMLFAFMATSFLEPDLIFYGQLHLLSRITWSIINLGDLFALPVCLSLVIYASKRNYKYHQWLDNIVLLMLCSVSVAFLYTGKYVGSPSCITGLVLVALSVLFRFWKFSADIFSRIAPLGNISYAVYITHVPVMFLMGQILFFYGTAFTFSVRALIFMASTVLISYLLEKKIQPMVKNFFIKPTL